MNRYKNLDIELLDYRKGDDGESMRARVVFSPVGEQRDADALPVTFPGQLRKRLKKLEQRALAFDELIELGEALAALLLPPPVRKIYRDCLAKLRDDEGLRIRIRPHAPELAALPWEYAYVSRPDIPPGRKGPEGFLALDRKISLVRYEIAGQAPTPIQPLEHYDIRAIALLAEVEDPSYAALDLDREELNLRQALEGTGGIDARFLRPGSSNQLEEMLVDDAQVFHFSGHGEVEIQMGEEPGTIEGAGQLILAGDENHPAPVDAGTLALKLKDRGIRLIVLNACEAAGRDPVTPWSGVASTLAQQGIPAVVGMQYTIRDGSAIAFSRGFYRALANGDSIDTAVSEGRLGVLGRGGGEERDWGVPVLYMRGSRSVLFPPPIVPLRRNLALAIGAIALLSAWFFLHIFPLAEEGANRTMASLGLGAGAVAGMFAVWKVIGTFAVKTVKSERGSIFERWLRHRNAKGILMMALMASIVLFSTTSSVYLEDNSPDVDAVGLSVETSDGLPFPRLPQLATSKEAGDKLDGGPIFMFPPPFELRLNVDRPIGWSLEDGDEVVRPRPWKRVKLLVEGNLRELELRVLRLVPNKFLMDVLPSRSNTTTTKTYQLRLTLSGETHVVEDYRPGVIWAGGPVNLLKRISEKENESDRQASLERCLAGAGQFREQIMSKWNSHQEFLKIPIIRPDDEVTIEVLDASGATVWSRKTVSGGTLSTNTINPQCLEVL